MTVDTVTRAQSLIEKGKYDEAVRLLRQVVNDPTYDKAGKADAFQLLGTMTQVDPTAVGDDYALPYYNHALELCPNHLWALHGIVTTFGDHAPDHQDLNALKQAIDQLMPRLDELGPSAAEAVRRKNDLVRGRT